MQKYGEHKKTAIIFGSTGQDGSYLSELLLSKDYVVVGVNRRSSTITTERLAAVAGNPNFKLVEGDIVDPSSVNQIITEYQPEECYNLAAQSHVGTSFAQPSYTFEVDAKGPLLILEAIRHYSPHTRFYQASSSEMFGSNCSTKITGHFVGMEPEADMYGYINRGIDRYQDESTPLSPNSPYAIAKTAAHHTVRMYRDAYKIHASAGILFNHESERRGENFVTRKITKWVADNAFDSTGAGADKLWVNFKRDFKKLKLGNISAIRDWGHARDYVEAMWLMLQQDKPDDYIIGTGEGHSVGEFLEEVFEYIGYPDIDTDKRTWKDFVEIDPALYRPNEVPYLRCDAGKAKEKLGWTPKIDFKTLVRLMVRSDLYGKNKEV